MLRGLFGRKATPAARARLTANTRPALVYAIGDVHGCAAELEQLERQIVDDATGTDCEKWIVMLGDYVDRGPASAAVLDRLCAAPPAGFRRICLAGNHDVMMLDFLRAPSLQSPWLDFGGRETLASYGIGETLFAGASLSARRHILTSHIPREHIELLESLAATLSLPGLVFAHAGIRPGLPLERQVEQDLLWIREPFLSDTEPRPFRVVHGHTPGPEPVLTPNRIGIDTGAFATGILTALRIDADDELAFFNTAKSSASLTK